MNEHKDCIWSRLTNIAKELQQVVSETMACCLVKVRRWLQTAAIPDHTQLRSLQAPGHLVKWHDPSTTRTRRWCWYTWLRRWSTARQMAS